MRRKRDRMRHPFAALAGQYGHEEGLHDWVNCRHGAYVSTHVRVGQVYACPQKYGYRRIMCLKITVTEDMEVTVNRESVREYVARQRDRYRKARAEKGRILDEVVAVTEYHRKSAVRLLSGRSREGKGGRVGRPVEYGPEVAAAAGVVHEGAGGIGAKRLHPFVGELASRLSAFGELEMDSETEGCSGAQVHTFERLLAAAQVPVRKRVTSLTKAGTLLRTESRCVRSGLGRCETGLRGSGHGGALWSDGGRAPPVDGDGGGRGDGVGGDGRGVGQDAGACGRGDTQDAKEVACPLLGLDSDNGSEFINHGLYATARTMGNLHQEQAVPKERQRARRHEERSGGTSTGHGQLVGGPGRWSHSLARLHGTSSSLYGHGQEPERCPGGAAGAGTTPYQRLQSGAWALDGGWTTLSIAQSALAES